MYESESQRLQKEADNFTKKYEHERKRYMILEDQYKQALAQKKDKMKTSNVDRLSGTNQKKTKARIKVLENQLEKQVTKYNSIMSKNKNFKRQVDVKRKELDTGEKVLAGLTKDLKKATKQIKKMNMDNVKMASDTEDTHNQILALKAKHEQEKHNFEGKMQDLQKKLEETDTSSKRMKRSQMLDDTPSKIIPGNEEFSNPADLLQARLNKWYANNKEKKQLMDKYIRNVGVIEDAFEQIQEQTGIQSIEEIVTTFIKAEEQNYSLYNYVNKLNSDIDTIEEQNKNIRREIQRHEELMEMSDKKKQEKIEHIKNDLEVSKFNMEKQESEISTKAKNLAEIQKHVEKMVSMFATSHLPLAVAQAMQYDEDTQFTDKNAT